MTWVMEEMEDHSLGTTSKTNKKKNLKSMLLQIDQSKTCFSQLNKSLCELI